MTVVVLMADAPVEGIACAELVEETPLTPADGLELYEAVLKDVYQTLAASSVDVLVNYPAQSDVSGGKESSLAPETALRKLAGEAVEPDRLADFRFEVQVGSDFSAKAGNAITHLLEDEEVTSAAVLRPCVPRLVRSVVDEASIKLRRNEVVLGPAGEGDVFFAGFTAPIDFEGVFEDRSLEEVAARAGDEGLTVDFVRNREVLRTARDFRSVVTRLRAAVLAGKPVPGHTWSFIEEQGLRVEGGELIVPESVETDRS